MGKFSCWTLFSLPDKEYLVILGKRDDSDLQPSYRGELVGVYQLDPPVHSLDEAKTQILKELPKIVV